MALRDPFTLLLLLAALQVILKDLFMVILMALVQDFLDLLSALLKLKKFTEELMEFMESTEEPTECMQEYMQEARARGLRPSGAALHCVSTPKSSKRSSPRSRETSTTADVRAARRGKSSSAAISRGRSR